MGNRTFAAAFILFFGANSRAAMPTGSFGRLNQGQWGAASSEAFPGEIKGRVLAEPEVLKINATQAVGSVEVDLKRPPDASLKLRPLFNKQWKQADAFGVGRDQFFLSVTFDAFGDAYLSVMSNDWDSPFFYKFERGMGGRFRTADGVYEISLDVSIFRARLSNYVVVKKEGVDEPVYRRRIKDVLLAAYMTGKSVVLGGKLYHVFYSYDLDLTKTPVEIDPARFGIVLIFDEYDEAQDEHDFHSFVVPQGDLSSGQTVLKELHDGQPAGLRYDAQEETLHLYHLRPAEQKFLEEIG